MAYVFDNFQRPNGALGGAWSVPAKPAGAIGTGSIVLLNHGYAPTVGAATNFSSSVWQGITFGNDQWAQASLVNTPTNKAVVSITACTSSAGTSTYTYTLTSGVALFTGMQIYIAGMTNSGNNSTVGFIITGLGAGTFSIANASPGANESGSAGTGTVPSDIFLGLVIRATDINNCYFTFIGQNSGAFASNGVSADQRQYVQELWKLSGGTFTFLMASGVAQGGFPTISDVAGTTYRLGAVGTTITVYRNGVQLYHSVDGSNTSGVPGIQASSANGAPEYANPTAYTGGGDNGIQWTNFYAGDTPGQLASDNFTRANGGLGANWTTNPTETAPQIASNKAEGQSLDVNNGAFYSAISFPNDQYSEITVSASVNNQCYVLAKCRQSVGAKTAYFLQVQGPIGSSAVFSLFKVIAGSQTQLGSSLTSQTLTAGDVFRVSAQGTTITGYQNGYQIIQATDGTIASGSPGFTLQPHTALVDAQISLWAGGAIVNPTLPGNASSSWLTLANANALRGLKH